MAGDFDCCARVVLAEEIRDLHADLHDVEFRDCTYPGCIAARKVLT